MQVAAMVAAAEGVLARFGQVPRAVREELVQEAVLRVLQLDGGTVRRPAGLARRIARNLAVDWLRGQRLEVVGLEREPACTRWVRQVEAGLDAARVWAAVDEAPASYRRALRWVYGQERPLCELVARERRGEEPVHRARDRVYKQRARGVVWAQRRLGIA